MAIDFELKHPPIALPNGGGEPDIALALHNYLELLVRANITDPELWPEGSKHGADLLKEIREIEAQCIEKHGRFDCDLMEEGVEDHYEDLLSAMRALLHPEIDAEWEMVKQRRRTEQVK